MNLYYRYPQHRGPRPSPLRRLGRLLFALLLLGGMAAGLFLLFFRGYVTEGPQGQSLHPPLLGGQSPTAPAGGAVSGLTLPDAAPALTPAPEPLQAVYLPAGAVVEGSYGDILRQSRGNALLFDLKDARGDLGFVSRLPLAIDAGASAADPALDEAIRAINREEGLYTIARIACFRDEALTGWRPDLALLRPSGSPWRDETGAAWLSPAAGEVQGYLLDLCREAVALGFDEVLLTHCAYPTEGEPGDRPTELEDLAALETVLADFYGEARSLLEEAGLRLSILWDGDPSGGQTAQALSLGAHRIWLREGESRDLPAFQPRHPPGAELAPVNIRQNPGESTADWAVCPTKF